MAKKNPKPIGNLNSKIFQEERQIGREASAMATRYVRSKIRESSLILRGIGSPNKKGKKNKLERLPILKATAVKPAMGTHRLLGFDFQSNRAGFVHHFGIVKDNTRYVRTHKKTGTVYKQSNPSFKSQAFFDDIYKNSGALKRLEEGLSKTRVRAVTVQLQNIVFDINKQDG